MQTYRLVALSSPLPGREEEYERWYDEQHIPDCLKLDGFLSAQRFRIEGKPAGYKSKKTAGSNFSMVVCPCVKGDLYHGGDEIGCGSCHKTKGTTLICSRCKEQVYCSEKCQKKDYRRHKACCRTPESRAKMFGANFAMWQNTHIPPTGASGCAQQ